MKAHIPYVLCRIFYSGGLISRSDLVTERCDMRIGVSPAEAGLGSWDGYPGFRFASPWAIIVAALRARSIEPSAVSLIGSSRARNEGLRQKAGDADASLKGSSICGAD